MPSHRRDIFDVGFCWSIPSHFNRFSCDWVLSATTADYKRNGKFQHGIFVVARYSLSILSKHQCGYHVRAYFQMTIHILRVAQLDIRQIWRLNMHSTQIISNIHSTIRWCLYSKCGDAFSSNVICEYIFSSWKTWPGRLDEISKITRIQRRSWRTCVLYFSIIISIS